jgi:hypothetical protein
VGGTFITPSFSMISGPYRVSNISIEFLSFSDFTLTIARIKKESVKNDVDKSQFVINYHASFYDMKQEELIRALLKMANRSL